MKMFATLTRAALLASVLIGATAHADALVLTDPIQLGRLSRNGIPQDWSHFTLDPSTNGEQFPGVINPSTPYHYHEYFFNVGVTNFIQVSIDSNSPYTFFSAYQTYYNPTDLSQDWLGDGGGSGNYNFDNVPANEVDPRFFQVVPGLNTTLVIVVNESVPNAGIGAPFDLLVEGFTDDQYSSDPVDLQPTSAANRIPEPSTMLLLGFAPLALLARRRTAQRRSDAIAA